MGQRAEKRYGREGNRWVNQTPSGEQVAEWFKGNVPIDEALDHEHYVGGVTLIPNNERSKAVVGWEGTNPVVEDVFDLVLTPYMRVETRVKYFHDLCAAKKWIGFLDPLPPEKPDLRLPHGHGLFSTGVVTGDKKEARFVGCSMRVSAWEKKGFKEEPYVVDKRTGEIGFRRSGTLVLQGSPGTKVVPTLGKYGADVNALMKAETGAVGRALGMAGMLVIPGTGIATAEDLQEEGSSAPVSEGAELPDDFIATSELDGDEKLREEIAEWIEIMTHAFPEAEKDFKTWAKERSFGKLSEVTSPALRGIHRKAKAMLDAAIEAAEKPTVKPDAESAAE